MAHATRSKGNQPIEEFPSILEGLEASPPKNRREIKALWDANKRLRAAGSTPKQTHKRNSNNKKEEIDSTTMERETVEIVDGNMDTSESLGVTRKPDELMEEANTLARKLDDALKEVNNTTNNESNNTASDTTKTPEISSAPKQSISFAKTTQFLGNGPALPRNSTLLTPKYSTVAAKLPPVIPPSTQPTAKAKQGPPKPPPEPRILPDDPEPEGRTPEPDEHLYTFVARIEVNVPACNSIPIKILNMLAYAVSILRRADPTATFLHLTDPARQAGTIQEMPRFQEFFKQWAKFEHVMENFRNYRLDNNKTRRFNLSAVIGCNMEPKELIEDCFIDFDRDISAAQGGGKVSLSFKQLQVVDTNRNWILFGVPATSDPGAFHAMVRPILQDAMHSMAKKNASKYPASKYGGELPEFAVSNMYVLNVPWEKTKGLEAKHKKCFHFEIHSSDNKIFGNIFKYMGLSRLDKRYFGELARFFEGPGPDGSAAQKDDLGKMLTNHVAVVRSLGKITLPGIMDMDTAITCHLSVDADGDPRNDVTLSLRRILMKQRINKPKVWQCILPNANGGWEGYYANGFGCGEHKQKALMWATSIGAHTRFHLLRRGVLPESVVNFIHSAFTNDAVVEAFGAKLINGEVFTFGAATAASMSLAIQNSDWVNASLGMAEATDGEAVYSRPLIALQFNTDEAEHNYAQDRNPIIQDSGSVAYSTAGETMLGGKSGDYGDYDDGNDAVFKVAMLTDGDSVAASSIGSTDSQEWGMKASGATTGVIDNIDMILNQANTLTTRTTEPPPPTVSMMEEMQRQINQLLADNSNLRAAAAAAPNLGSHPVASPTDVPGAQAKGGGGD